MSSLKCYKPVTCKREASIDLLKYANDTRSEGHFNDVTITIENECIPANKMVLSCHSVFFEKMFKCEMKEKHENKVKIESVDGKAVKSLVEYMYNGSIDIDDRNVFEMLAAADYLQLMDVKQFCLQYLQSKVTIDNWLDDNWLATLQALTLFSSEASKHEIYQYMSKHFNEIVQTHDFSYLSHDDLKNMILYCYQTDVQATSLCQSIVNWIKHDVEARKHNILDLFVLAKVDQLPHEFIEDLLKEDFIKTNFDCRQFLVALKLLVKNQKDEKVESKMISVTGNITPSKVPDVRSSHDCNLTNYPGIPLNLSGLCVKTDGKDGVWLYNVKDQFESWIKVSPMIERRCVMGATEHNGKIVVAGGWNGSDTLASAEFYDMPNKKWKQVASMKQCRNTPALVSCQGYLYALGGWDDAGECLSSVERLTDLKNDWEECPPMLRAKRWFAAVSCSNVMYVIGGQSNHDDSAITNTVEKFDPDKNKWICVSAMNIKRRAHAACVIHGKIYVVGGIDTENKYVDKIECYTPSTDSWSIVGTTILDLYHHSIVAV